MQLERRLLRHTFGSVADPSAITRAVTVAISITNASATSGGHNAAFRSGDAHHCPGRFELFRLQGYSDGDRRRRCAERKSDSRRITVGHLSRHPCHSSRISNIQLADDAVHRSSRTTVHVLHVLLSMKAGYSAHDELARICLLADVRTDADQPSSETHRDVADGHARVAIMNARAREVLSCHALPPQLAVKTEVAGNYSRTVIACRNFPPASVCSHGGGVQ